MEREPYFRELSTCLQREGFTVPLEEDGLLPVEWNGSPLCGISRNGQCAEGRNREERRSDERSRSASGPRGGCVLPGRCALGYNGGCVSTPRSCACWGGGEGGAQGLLGSVPACLPGADIGPASVIFPACPPHAVVLPILQQGLLIRYDLCHTLFHEGYGLHSVLLGAVSQLQPMGSHPSLFFTVSVEAVLYDYTLSGYCYFPRLLLY